MTTLLERVPTAAAYVMPGDVVLRPVAQALTTDGSRIFRTADGVPWRYCGVTAFGLAHVYACGDVAKVDRFLEAFARYNVLRVFYYVEWEGTGWPCTPADDLIRFCQYVGARGWYVELVLLTSDTGARVGDAAALVEALSDHHAELPNLLIEVGNEPSVNGIDTAPFRDLLEHSGFQHSSGDYDRIENSDGTVAYDGLAIHYGTYVTTHTARDAEWARRAHDLFEIYDGGGPNAPSDPPHHKPCIGDEPKRPDDAGYNVLEFRAHAGACALLGGGATFHCAEAKYGTVPPAADLTCAEAFAEGLHAFPADAPLGAYRRIDENSSNPKARTYVTGDQHMTRVCPDTPAAPEPGWTPIDDAGILWRR